MMKKGYTLIEIMLVVGIVSLVVVAGYAGFRAFARRQAVATSAREMRTVLRLIQQKALSGEKPEGCNDQLDGYEVSFNSTGYSASVVCGSFSGQIKNVLLPSNISLSLPSTNPVLFKSIGNGTNIPAGTKVYITIEDSAADYQDTVSVGAGGNVQ